MENRVGVGTITTDRPGPAFGFRPLLKRRRGCPVPRWKASSKEVVVHDQGGCGCSSYGVRIVVSGAAALNTEPGSVLPRVKISSQRKISILELGRLSESARRNHRGLARATD